jgi:hypothetical protein
MDEKERATGREDEPGAPTRMMRAALASFIVDV